ncbi:uncharacterized protein N7479_004752 [Penicillium vulpinum]|nr:uncharacterized protein N7479_004752 [Penicillium vulpinum]KAJ5964876.1 hypothetical protein N7479_004752 [Penicillium vulpinum]
MPSNPENGMPGYEYAEHSFLGDIIDLKLENGGTQEAAKTPLKLPNGLSLTYGQINGLAGDFYGTDRPISDGRNPADKAKRFLDAWFWLAEDTHRQPKEATDILNLLQEEVKLVNEAAARGEDPSTVYPKLPNIDAKLTFLTLTRPSGFPSYPMLASINWDHFGEDAQKAYNTGHLAALQYACSAGSDLHLAYGMNAFADHFLEDLFSAGHLRTPRRSLHAPPNLSADWCAKYMHDEDCAIGLNVTNSNKTSFRVYGDKRLLDKANIVTRDLCIKALQYSADEIFDAWKNKVIPTSFQALELAPTLESSRQPQELSPLFRLPVPSDKKQVVWRRGDIKNRRAKQDDYTQDWWYLTTVNLCKSSKLWNYPITLNSTFSEEK